jgi:hypothetical protein
VEAADGAEAPDALRHADVGFVATDGRKPRIGGLELLKNLPVSVILSSGYADGAVAVPVRVPRLSRSVCIARCGVAA